jgi:hypothetical protein
VSDSDAHLVQVGSACVCSRGRPNMLNRRDEQREQHSNDRERNQHLDERERKPSNYAV